jgi:hypothetical protein
MKQPKLFVLTYPLAVLGDFRVLILIQSLGGEPPVLLRAFSVSRVFFPLIADQLPDHPLLIFKM